MSRSRLISSIVCALALAVAVGTAGCKAPEKVVSAWPVADAERVVPKPPEPPRWPLTGLDAPDAAAVARRPLSIKIENSPQARPQTGLNSADVVYESVTEGGITRFNCIFHSKVPPQVGPIRSARLSDLWVVPQYHGLFFFSGASSSVNSAVNKAKLPNLSEDAGVSYPYFRSSSRSAPHNLFLDTKKAYAEAKKRGFALTDSVPAFKYDRRSSAATPTAMSVFIPFSQANKVQWTYDPKSKTYLRENNGARHNDAETGKQVAARNVIVLRAKYNPISRDKVGSVTYDINLGGKGPVTIFHDGQRFEGTWEAARGNPPKFKDAEGRPIKLAPGNSWVQVVAPDVTVTIK